MSVAIIVVLIALITVVLALVFALVLAYPDYRKMKKLKDEYSANSSCKQPIYSMSFREVNSDTECEELEDEYAQYMWSCSRAYNGTNLLEKLRCKLIDFFGNMNL